MYTAKHVSSLQQHLQSKGGDAIIGFVPTMGALHDGHISLLKPSTEECDTTVCSIFVNPTQFNKQEDYDNYPDRLRSDVWKLLDETTCDTLFVPSAEDMYPDGQQGYKAPDVGPVTQVMEGKHRPGHFEGMMQVIERFLTIINPHFIYMGAKDYQQWIIVQRLCEARGFRTKVRVCPTVREADGLAMSSRNLRLSKEGRKKGLVLIENLRMAKEKIRTMQPTAIEELAMKNMAETPDCVPEYFEIRDKDTLERPKEGQLENLMALTACNVEGIRLIDNLVF